MPIILSIETATDVCSIAISKEGDVLKEITLDNGMRHSSRLTSIIEEGVSSEGLEMSDVAAVAISNGPGSYTGLRVGASTAKAICYALDIPMISISTLKALTIPTEARSSEDIDNYILSTIDARRSEVYAAVYKNGVEYKEAHSLIWSQESILDLSTRYPALTICGTGIEKAAELFEDFGNVELLPTRCSASLIASLALGQYNEGAFVDIAYHDPFYFKSPNITTPKKKILG